MLICNVCVRDLSESARLLGEDITIELHNAAHQLELFEAMNRVVGAGRMTLNFLPTNSPLQKALMDLDLLIQNRKRGYERGESDVPA